MATMRSAMTVYTPIENITIDVAANLQEIPVHLINKNRNEHRLHIDPSKEAEMRESISEIGMLHAVTVCPATNGRYDLVTGSRRVTAHRQLNREFIRANVAELTTLERFITAGHENTSREDTPGWSDTIVTKNALEEHLKLYSTELTKFLYRLKNAEEQNVKPHPGDAKLEPLARRIITAGTGKTLAYFIRYCLPLLTMDKAVIASLERGTITQLMAAALNKIPSQRSRRSLLEKAAKGEISVADVKQKLKGKKQNQPRHVVCSEELRSLLWLEMSPETKELITSTLSSLIATIKEEQSLRLEGQATAEVEEQPSGEAGTVVIDPTENDQANVEASAPPTPKTDKARKQSKPPRDATQTTHSDIPQTTQPTTPQPIMN